MTGQPDLVVVGGGATGLSAAATARRAGRRVVLVEAERPGGDCTFWGCVPSKALLAAAHRAHVARDSGRFGVVADPRVDGATVLGRVRAVVEEIAQDESPELLRSHGIEVVQGRARFASERALVVDGHGELRCDRFVIATGARAAVPPVPGLDAVPFLDNRSVFGVRDLPEHLVVLGGGPIGCELAQAFRRLGSRVTLVEAAPRLLGRDDPDAAAVLLDVLRRDGVDVRLGTSAVRAEAGPVLHLSDGRSVAGTHLLVAVGRRPATDDLELAAAGARVDDAGRVVVDDRLRAAPTVWAAGDCASPLQLTHVGHEQGRVAASNALGLGLLRSRWKDRAVPWVTFTDPEVAQVGLTEAQALERHGDGVRVSVVAARDSDRGRTADERDGFVKLVAAPRLGRMELGRLVGLTAVGPAAGELLAAGGLAVRSGMLLPRLATTTVAYPTRAVSLRLAAARFFGPYGGEPARPARKG